MAGDDEGVRELTRKERDGARARVERALADFDTHVAVEDEEGLLVGPVEVQGAAVTARSRVLEDRELAAC
jgi:hypothetical protein